MLQFISKEDVWRCLDQGLHNKLGWAPLNIHLNSARLNKEERRVTPHDGSGH